MTVEDKQADKLPSNLTNVPSDGYQTQGPPQPEQVNLDWSQMDEEQRRAALARMRHSAAHVMADAVLSLFPDAKLGIGPSIEDGFYYDFDLPRSITPEDLSEIEKRMARIIKGKYRFERVALERAEARRWFEEHGQQYKTELIDDLPEDEQITFYRDGKFVDLCRGPHVENTGQIGAFKLQNIAGAYWRGDEKRPMLQRIYGTAFPTKEELEHHLFLLEEAKRRDHRRIGKELHLFTFADEVGTGLPLWLPKGAMLRSILERYIVDLERAHGYEHVYTPHVARTEMYKISGHLEHYKDSMFPIMHFEDGEEMVLRPMNCPHHIMIYKSQMRSYRDLPLKIAELGTMYRYERSGELTGLTRVRAMTLNDAHIFCTPEQMESEFISVVNLILEAYRVLGFKEYLFRLSLRDPNDPKYVQNDEMWNKAENALRKALNDMGMQYYEGIGEAAFYGPKLDVQVRNVLGKDETLSTVQLDFHMPQQFGLEYIGEDGQPHTPVMIHRGVLSTMERFVAFLIENYAGTFPVWLSPIQAIVVPIADRHKEYAQQVTNQLKDAGLRVDLDDRDQRMNYKIREAQMQKIPYILVVGDQEAANGAVAVRLRSNENLGAKPISEFITMAKQAIEAHE